MTYIGDKGKAKREFGHDPRPLREDWKETIRHKVELLGLKSP